MSLDTNSPSLSASIKSWWPVVAFILVYSFLSVQKVTSMQIDIDNIKETQGEYKKTAVDIAEIKSDLKNMGSTLSRLLDDTLKGKSRN